MSLLAPSSSFLHLGQALTVNQAGCWVQRLIDHYMSGVEKLKPCTLDDVEFEDYAPRLWRLLRHAGVLEQSLCRMCFFLHPQVVRTVIAIIVAARRQRNLFTQSADTKADPCYILDNTVIERMGVYLQEVVAHLIATDNWVKTKEYQQLKDAFDAHLDEMQGPLAPFQTSQPGSSQQAEQENGIAEDDLLASFLSSISPSHFFGDPPLPNADYAIWRGNFTPVTSQEERPYQSPSLYACGSSREDESASTSSTSTTVFSLGPEPSAMDAAALEDDVPTIQRRSPTPPVEPNECSPSRTPPPSPHLLSPYPSTPRRAASLPPDARRLRGNRRPPSTPPSSPSPRPKKRKRPAQDNPHPSTMKPQKMRRIHIGPPDALTSSDEENKPTLGQALPVHAPRPTLALPSRRRSLRRTRSRETIPRPSSPDPAGPSTFLLHSDAADDADIESTTVEHDDWDAMSFAMLGDDDRHFGGSPRIESPPRRRSLGDLFHSIRGFFRRL